MLTRTGRESTAIRAASLEFWIVKTVGDARRRPIAILQRRNETALA